MCEHMDSGKNNLQADNPTKIILSKSELFLFSKKAFGNKISSLESQGKSGGRKLIPGVNDLLTKFPEIAAEAHGFNPSEVTYGTKQFFSWKCPEGHIYPARVAHRTGAGNGREGVGTNCPSCRFLNKKGGTVKVIPPGLSFQDCYPELAKESHGWDPSKTLASLKPVREWICPVGHIYRTSSVRAKAIRNGDATQQAIKLSGCEGCLVCTDRQLLKGYNDFATKAPQLVSEAVGWDPESTLCSHGKRVQWRGVCGHIYKRSPTYRIKSSHLSGMACPSCGHGGGFRVEKPGFLYLLKRPGQIKFGITNYPENRIEQSHRRNGWSVSDIAGCLFGNEILHAETRLKRAVKNRKIPTGKDVCGDNCFDGYTETLITTALDASSLAELFHKLKLKPPAFLSA